MICHRPIVVLAMMLLPATSFAQLPDSWFCFETTTVVEGDGPEYLITTTIEAVHDVAVAAVELEVPGGVTFLEGQQITTLEDLSRGSRQRVIVRLSTELPDRFEINVNVRGLASDLVPAEGLPPEMSLAEAASMGPVKSERFFLGAVPEVIPLETLPHQVASAIRTLYGQYSDGEIGQCTFEGAVVFSVGLNAHDAGSSVVDLRGDVLGECNYAQDLVSDICHSLDACQTIYRVESNIWGQMPVDIYGLVAAAAE